MHGDADIAAIGALVADRGRARILLALGDGRALPASVLADEAGVAASTASAHLSRLVEGGLLRVERHGRHRYFRLGGPEVGELIESLARISPPARVRSLKQGSTANAIRFARTCYDHLAGMLGTRLMQALLEQELLTGGDGVFDPQARRADRLAAPGYDYDYRLTPTGVRELKAFGIDFDSLPPRRPLVRYCVDWSERRHHLAGSLGAAVAARMLELGWVRRAQRSRALHVSDDGYAGLREQFEIAHSALSHTHSMSGPDLALAISVFLACAVEAVEALTIVLAVGVTRSWRWALIGVAAATVALAAIVAALGPALASVPINALRVVVGGLLLVFGLQWLRKAVLRAAGLKAMHDEEKAFAAETDAARAAAGAGGGFDAYTFTIAFKGVLLEGLEVAFIVVTFGASQHNVGLAAAAAALAVLVVVVTGFAVRAPLARVPENAMKFAVGVMLTSFGIFWGTEGAGATWPGGDAALLVIIPGVLLASLGLVQWLRREAPAPAIGKSAA